MQGERHPGRKAQLGEAKRGVQDGRGCCNGNDKNMHVTEVASHAACDYVLRQRSFEGPQGGRPGPRSALQLGTGHGCGHLGF